MDDHINLFWPEIKQPPCFDHLKPFVHHCCRIYGDLLPHRPVGMPEGIFPGDSRQVVPGFSAKRAARSGQVNLLDSPGLFSGKTLKNGRMFRVNREDQHIFPLCLRHDQIAGDHQTLFIGQRHGFSGSDGAEGGL